MKAFLLELIPDFYVQLEKQMKEMLVWTDEVEVDEAGAELGVPQQQLRVEANLRFCMNELTAFRTLHQPTRTHVLYRMEKAVRYVVVGELLLAMFFLDFFGEAPSYVIVGREDILVQAKINNKLLSALR